MKKLFFLLFLFLLVLPFGFSASLWGFDSLKYNFFPVGGFSDINGGSFWFSFLDVNVVSVGDVNAVSVTAINFFGDGSGLTGITATADVNGQDVRLNNVSVDGNLGVTGDSNFTNIGVSGAVYSSAPLTISSDINEALSTFQIREEDDAENYPGWTIDAELEDTDVTNLTIRTGAEYWLIMGPDSWGGTFQSMDIGSSISDGIVTITADRLVPPRTVDEVKLGMPGQEWKALYTDDINAIGDANIGGNLGVTGDSNFTSVGFLGNSFFNWEASGSSYFSGDTYLGNGLSFTNSTDFSERYISLSTASRGTLDLDDGVHSFAELDFSGLTKDYYYKFPEKDGNFALSGTDENFSNLGVSGYYFGDGSKLTGLSGDANHTNTAVSGNTFLTNVNVAKDLNVETIRTTGVGGILSINAQETGLRSTTINPTELYFLNQADNNWAGFYFDSDSVYPHEFVFIASDNATKFIVESDANFTNIGVSGYYFGDGSKLTGITASGVTVTMDANNTERLWLYGDLNKHFPGYIGATSDINIGIHALTATDLNAIRINVKGNVSIDKNVSALDGNFGNISIPLVYNVTQEPSGFVDRTTSSLSFVDSTRVFTITGTNFPVFINGIEKLKSTENITIADGNATHWIYYAANGVLSQSLTAPSFSLPLIATIYYNTDIDNGVLGEERHGLKMDVDTHHVLHYTVGTRYESGLTGTFDNTTFSTTAGKIDDEDLEHSIGAQTRCKVFYKSGSSDFVWDANTTTYYKAIAGTLQYNNGNVLANVTNNKYAAYWVFATNDLNTPIWSLMGQREDTLLADARNNNKYESLILGTLPFQEMKLLYRIIMRNQGGTPTYIEAQDNRVSSNLPAGTFIASQHNALTGLNWSQAGHTFDADLNVDGYAVKAFADSNFNNAAFSGNLFANNLKIFGVTIGADSNFSNIGISGFIFGNGSKLTGVIASNVTATMDANNTERLWLYGDLNKHFYGKNDLNSLFCQLSDSNDASRLSYTVISNPPWWAKTNADLNTIIDRNTPSRMLYRILADLNGSFPGYIGATADINMGAYALKAFGDSNFANARFSGNSFLNALFATGDANFSNFKATGGAFFNTLTAIGDSNFTNLGVSEGLFNSYYWGEYIKLPSWGDITWDEGGEDQTLLTISGSKRLYVNNIGDDGGILDFSGITPPHKIFTLPNKDGNFALSGTDENFTNLGLAGNAHITGRTYTVGLTSTVDLNVTNGTSTGIGFSADSNKIWSGGKIVWDSNGTHGCIGGC